MAGISSAKSLTRQAFEEKARKRAQDELQNAQEKKKKVSGQIISMPHIIEYRNITCRSELRKTSDGS